MSEVVRIERAVYGGSGLARTPQGATVFVPFTLPDEMVDAELIQPGNDAHLLRMLEPSPSRVVPPCPHFGPCGGCQYQMASYAEQLRLKRGILEETLQRAGVAALRDITTHSAEPWGYRNRIRLRVERVENQLRFGYNQRTSNRFLPITTCPIAAPVLWSAAQGLLTAAARDTMVAAWLDAAAEVEIFCNHDETRVQLTFLCSNRPAAPATFARALAALRLPQVTAAAALRTDVRTGRILGTLAESGAAGFAYRVPLPFEDAAEEETYWITRGGFFQVNRFLVPALVRLACTKHGQLRGGALAWDLFAGVGLFSRILARRFTRIVAVEANPVATADLRASLLRLSPNSSVVESTTIDFLRAAVLQRDRPELVVLDPPRAGAGTEACKLLSRLAPREIVYVSCDPTTLARDLRALQPNYRIAEMHMVDLFPQTFHIETVVVLERDS